MSRGPTISSSTKKSADTLKEIEEIKAVISDAKDALDSRGKAFEAYLLDMAYKSLEDRDPHLEFGSEQ